MSLKTQNCIEQISLLTCIGTSFPYIWLPIPVICLVYIYTNVVCPSHIDCWTYINNITNMYNKYGLPSHTRVKLCCSTPYIVY